MIILDPVEHRYTDEMGREYTSVSRVIEAVYPKKTWDGADPQVVANANERGRRVEAYFNCYLLQGGIEIPAGEREDVSDYTARLVEWWDASEFAGLNPRYMDIQSILSDKVNGIAGSADLILRTTQRILIDIKCVYELQKSYEIQLGSYTDMGAADRCGCLWVSKTAVQWVEFDAKEAVESWRDAKAWYLRMQKLEAKKKVKRVA